jgi:hypothetical protein
MKYICRYYSKHDKYLRFDFNSLQKKLRKNITKIMDIGPMFKFQNVHMYHMR